MRRSDVLRRTVKGRARLTNSERWFFVSRRLDALTIIRPETLLRWHRVGFRRAS
jgi:hypothetical protein